MFKMIIPLILSFGIGAHAQMIDTKYIKDGAVTSTKIAPNAVDLDTQTTGTLPVSKGGTGQTTPTGLANSVFPDQSGQAGKFLQTDGTETSWQLVPASGVSSLLSIGSTPNANGATISGTQLTLQPASASFGGVVTTGVQTFAGPKTFANQLSVSVTNGGLLFSAEAATAGDAETSITAGDVQFKTLLTRDSDTMIGNASNHPLSFSTNDQARLSISETGTVSVMNGLNFTLKGLTSGSVGFVAPVTGMDQIYTLPSSDGSSGQVLSTDGAGLLSWSTAASSGANATLSNLTSPTAINQDLLPAGSHSLGSSSARWSNVYGSTFNFTSSILGQTTGGSPRVQIISDTNAIPSGTSVGGVLKGLAALPVAVITDDTSSIASGSVLIESGNASNGNTGMISLRTGVVTGGGTRGKIKFVDGSEGTSGQCWVSSSTDGSGGWTACPGASGGANDTLSNLGTTAINASLNPDADASYDLGSSGAEWSNVWSNNFYTAGSMYFSANDFSLTANNGDALSISGGSASLSVNGGSSIALDNTGDIQLSASNSIVNVNSARIVGLSDPSDGTDAATKDYVDNAISGVDLSGYMLADFGNAQPATTSLDLGSNSITNVADPTNAQDVATKNYVDTAVGGGGGATTALDNLASTAVNASIIPATSEAIDLGASNKYWDEAFLYDIYSVAIKDAFSVAAIDVTSRILGDSAGGQALTFHNTTNLVSHKHFTPFSDSTYNLGSASNGWLTAFVGGVTGSTTLNTPLVLQSPDNGQGSQTNSNVNILTATKVVGSGGSGSINLTTGNHNTTGASGGVNITTGNTGGSSGNIVMTTGTASGTRGKIKFVDGSQGTVGHVWTQTNADGSGAWQAGGGGGANTTLSNLTSPTQINQHLVPDGATRTLGTGSTNQRWGGLHLQVTSPATAIDFYNGSTNELDLVMGGVTPSGQSGNGLWSTVTTPLFMYTQSRSLQNSALIQIETGRYNGTTPGQSSGALNLRTGDATLADGSSGNVNLQTGTIVSGGTRGKIRFIDGTEGTSGYVWTSTGTDGSGGWAPPPSSGPTISGSTGSPTAITAAGGFTAANARDQIIFYTTSESPSIALQTAAISGAGSGGAPATYSFAQTFTPTSTFDINNIEVGFSSSGGATGIMEMEIWGSTSTGAPDPQNIIGKSKTKFDLSVLTGTASAHSFYFRGLRLYNGVKYAMVLRGYGTTGSVTYIAASSAYAGGDQFYTTLPSLSAWSNNGTDSYFKIYSTVAVTANPKISAGTNVGDKLTLVAQSATVALTLSSGNGILVNSPYSGFQNDTISFLWDSTNWVETSRNHPY